MNTEPLRFLAYLHTPYSRPAHIRLFESNGVDAAAEVSLKGVSDAAIVSYDLPALVPYFREAGIRLPQRLIDVTEAARLARGRPISAKTLDSVGLWALLRRETAAATAARQLQSIIFRAGGRTDLSTSELVGLMTAVLQGVRELWLRTHEELVSRGELARFEDVEQPSGALLLETQFRGIRFDRDAVNQRIGKLGDSISRAATNLRLKWNVRRPNDSGALVAALGRDLRIREDEILKRPALASVIRARLDAVLDFVPDSHALAYEIKRFRACSHDKAILLHLSSRETDRVYPAFSVLGTVTARPLARTPALQYLSRSSRAVLLADTDKTLLYADFCQFEPGILADDSRDPKLIADFNSGDLYETLALRVFGTSSRRDHAKLIFLAFCYGMSVTRAAELIAAGERATTEIESMIATFFEEYGALEPWKSGIQGQLLRDGRIGSRLGNFRYRARDGRTLDAVERRWSLSQRIQGTASLILKRAMLKVAQRNCADLLLPMHDAALYQVTTGAAEHARHEIEHAFVEAFAEECPTLKPRVRFVPFAIDVEPGKGG